MRPLTALHLVALAFVLVMPMLVATAAEEVALTANYTTVTLRAGVNYTSPVPLALFFNNPVDVIVYRDGSAVTLDDVHNVTLANGVKLAVLSNVTAVVVPIIDESESIEGEALAANCFYPITAVTSAKATYKGPAKIRVRIINKNGDPYVRYYIVTIDDDPTGWQPIWYRNEKRHKNPPTLSFGFVAGNGRTVVVRIPEGTHRVFASVSAWLEAQAWEICFEYIPEQSSDDGGSSSGGSSSNGGGSGGSSSGGHSNPKIVPPPRSGGSSSGSKPQIVVIQQPGGSGGEKVVVVQQPSGGSIDPRIVAAAVGGGILLLALFFLAAGRK